MISPEHPVCTMQKRAIPGKRFLAGFPLLVFFLLLQLFYTILFFDSNKSVVGNINVLYSCLLSCQQLQNSSLLGISQENQWKSSRTTKNYISSSLMVKITRCSSVVQKNKSGCYAYLGGMCSNCFTVLSNFSSVSMQCVKRKLSVLAYYLHFSCLFPTDVCT